MADTLKPANSVRAPEIALDISLSEPLARVIGTPMAASMSAAIGARCSELLQELGLPGSVTVHELKTAPAGQRQPIAISSGSGEWPYPDEVPVRLLSYMSGEPLSIRGGAQVRAWAEAIEKQSKLLVDWVALCCREALNHRPGSLATPEMAAAYLQLLPQQSQASPTDAGAATFTLRKVLEFGLPLRDKARVTEALHGSRSADRTPAQAAEALIEALRPHVIEIAISFDYLKSIAHDGGDEAFQTIRRDAFDELGLRFPDFEFHHDDELRPGSFAFRINGLLTLPWVGLLPDGILAAESPVRLPEIAGALPAVNPLDGSECALIDRRDRDKLPGDTTVWTPLEYVALCLSRELRDNAAKFIDADFTRNSLYSLNATSRGLVTAVLEGLTEEQLTSLLRGLVAEGVPVLHLARILEIALSFDVVSSDPSYTTFDDRLPTSSAAAKQDPASLLAFVRMHLNRTLTQAATAGAGVLKSWALTADTEQSLRGTAPGYLSDGPGTALLAAISSALGEAALFAGTAPVLTSMDLRQRVRNAIAGRYPRTLVLARQEIAPVVEIETKGTIALSGPQEQHA